MANAEVTTSKGNDEYVARPILNGSLEIALSDVVNFEEEIVKLEKEVVKLQGEIKRCESMLSNEKFISKAPEAKINEEKEKLAHYKSQLEIVNKQLSDYKNR